MKRKPKVKIVSISGLNLNDATLNVMERMYMKLEERDKGHKLFYVTYVIERKQREAITSALDEMHSMREAITSLTLSYQRKYKLNRYGCAK